MKDVSKNPDPTPAEIREACAAIQSGWTPEEKLSRLREDWRPQRVTADGRTEALDNQQVIAFQRGVVANNAARHRAMGLAEADERDWFRNWPGLCAEERQHYEELLFRIPEVEWAPGQNDAGPEVAPVPEIQTSEAVIEQPPPKTLDELQKAHKQAHNEYRRAIQKVVDELKAAGIEAPKQISVDGDLRERHSAWWRNLHNEQPVAAAFALMNETSNALNEMIRQTTQEKNHDDPFRNSTSPDNSRRNRKSGSRHRGNDPDIQRLSSIEPRATGIQRPTTADQPSSGHAPG